MISKVINKSWLPGIIAAFTASLCCIGPIVAILGGISGVASSFSWIELARPYLIGLTVIAFALVWYQELFGRSAKEMDCCEVQKPSFWRTRNFLLLVTLISGLLVAFPYYSSMLYAKPKQSEISVNQQSQLKWVQFKIRGMGCADCTKHIDGNLSQVAGVVKVNTSFEKANTNIGFNSQKVSVDSLKTKSAN